MPLRAASGKVLGRYRASGELAVDVDVVQDLIYAPFYYQLLTGYKPITAAYADAIADAVLAGVMRLEALGTMLLYTASSHRIPEIGQLSRFVAANCARFAWLSTCLNSKYVMLGYFHFRYALRTLRKSPGFTAAAVLSLALGIAANTAIFSLVNGLLFHPAAVDHPEQVVVPRVKYTKLNMKSIVLSLPDFANIRDSRDVFETAAAATTQSFNYTGGDVPERLVGATVTWNG